MWSLEADYAARASVAATSEFGTPRANGTWLLELALNMKSPTIYDTVMNDGREERVVNQEATMAAREKQKLIKERFRSWVFTEPERTEKQALFEKVRNGSGPGHPEHSLDEKQLNRKILLSNA
jgi:N12 class adenine-specific DNA methylase